MTEALSKDPFDRWLTNLPSGWSLKKLGREFGVIGSGTTPPTDVPKWYGDGYPWVTTGELRESVITTTEKSITSEAAESFPTLRKYPPGTLLIAMYGATIGRLGLLGCEATTNQACCALAAPCGLETKYVFYWLQAFREQLIRKASGGGQPNVNQDTIRNLRISSPSLAEQTRIATFLDEQTARIDALIAEKERLLALIGEYRRSLLSAVITEGIPGRHSEFNAHSFLGRVPKDWMVGSFRHYVQVKSGQVDPEDDAYADMALIAPNHIEAGTGRLLFTETAAEQSAVSGKYWCDEGDVIYSKIRPALRKTVVAPFDCLCSADMYPLKGLGPLSNEYLFWYLLSEPFSDFAIQESQRVAMPKLNRETLADAAIPLPSIEEQREIVEFLQRNTASVDSLAEHTNNHISRLREYRSSLISAAVTGQLDIDAYETSSAMEMV